MKPNRGCEDCHYQAQCSAQENWTDAHGRYPQTDSDYAEVWSWAAALIENGDSDPCWRCEDSR